MECWIFWQGAWAGILHHVVNEHEWLMSSDNDMTHTKCQHGPLPEERDQNYLEKGSDALMALTNIVMDKRLLNNIPYYLNCRYDSLVCYFITLFQFIKRNITYVICIKMLICSGQFVMTQWCGIKFLWLAIKQMLLCCRHINVWQLNGVLRPIKISCFNKYVGWEIYTRQAADYWTSSLHIWELYAQSHLLHLPLGSLYPTQCKEELQILPSNTGNVYTCISMMSQSNRFHFFKIFLCNCDRG